MLFWLPNQQRIELKQGDTPQNNHNFSKMVLMLLESAKICLKLLLSRGFVRLLSKSAF